MWRIFFTFVAFYGAKHESSNASEKKSCSFETYFCISSVIALFFLPQKKNKLRLMGCCINSTENCNKSDVFSDFLDFIFDFVVKGRPLSRLN